MYHKQYTPYDDVNIILDRLLTDVKGILKEQFIGMYLFGSLANGGFDQSSDVDVLIVTKAEILDSRFSTLHSMHERIAVSDSRWATQLEISYIPQNALRRFNQSNITHPHLDRGNGEQLHWMKHESDWVIQRHTLRETKIVVEGPAPHTLIDPVSADDLRQAVVDVLPLWVTPLLEDPIQRIRPRGYQSFVVLSLCRMLYTLEHGAIVSKIVAAGWALQTLDIKWVPLIERAIIGRQNAGIARGTGVWQNSDLEVEPDDRNGTLDLIRFTMEYVNKKFS